MNSYAETMPASRKEKDSTNHLEHRSINHPAGPKYLKDLALAYALTCRALRAPISARRISTWPPGHCERRRPGLIRRPAGNWIRFEADRECARQQRPGGGILGGFACAGYHRGVTMNSYQARNAVPARAPAGRALASSYLSPRRGPTALRIALGTRLRRLREASGITSVEAAEAIRATPSKISRVERGRTTARQRDVADLLSLYGVTDQAEREELLELVRQASTPGWWQQYSDLLPRWFESYVGLETEASVIRSYEVQFVQGLLQAEDYARAVILISNAHAPAEEIDRRVSLRMGRQELLTQPGAPEFWAVLDEAALR